MHLQKLNKKNKLTLSQENLILFHMNNNGRDQLALAHP